jgi:hypothetical protein
MHPTNSTIAQDGAPWARLRSAVAPACMVLAPLFLLAGEVLHPDRSTDPARQVAIVGKMPACGICHICCCSSASC